MHLRDAVMLTPCAQKMTTYGRVEVCHVGHGAYDVYVYGRTIQRTHCATINGVEQRMAALGIDVAVDWFPVGSPP
jgi:hypothetical protein